MYLVFSESVWTRASRIYGNCGRRRDITMYQLDAMELHRGVDTFTGSKERVSTMDLDQHWKNYELLYRGTPHLLT